MTAQKESFTQSALFVGACAALLVCLAAEASDFRVTPYVQYPTRTAITVMWFAQTNTTGQLRYWIQGGDTTTVSSAGTLATNLDYCAAETNKANSQPYTLPWQHHERLTDLTAGTTYNYSVTQGATTYSKYFKTAPDTYSPIRFIYCNDPETEPESTGAKVNWPLVADGDSRLYFIDQTTGYASNLVTIARRHPDLLVIAGDLPEYGGEQRDWDEFWRHNAGSLNDLAGCTPIVAALGNHCYGAGDRNTANGGFSQPASEQAVGKWLTYFDNPTNGAGNAAQQERFYRLDYGPASIIVLDTNNGDDSDITKDTNLYLKRADGCQAPDFNPGSVQYQWLERQLADTQTNSLFTFVVSHHIPFSVGYHNRTNTANFSEPYSGTTTRVLTNLLMRYGADAWLCGHDEICEHSQVSGREIGPRGNWTNAYKLHVFDTGSAGDGLRGVGQVTNAWETFRAHVNAPEMYDASGILTNGGKHYGHMEINIGPNAQGVWEAKLTPVYVFVYTNSSGKAMGFDRRTYNDEVTLRYVPTLRPNVLLIR